MVQPEHAPLLDECGVASSDRGVNINHADMRIEVVKREISQGALAGFSVEMTDYAARLVIAALDSYDEASYHAAYRLGYQDGFEAGSRRA